MNKDIKYDFKVKLLNMAVAILESKGRRMFDNEMKKPESSRKDIIPYTTEDVIREAEKLNKFVQLENYE